MKSYLHTDIQTDSNSVFTKLYSWKSPERYWVPRDRAWFTVYTIFFLLIILAGVLLKEFIFILAVLAFAFLWFVNAIIPPEITEHTITTIGVRTYGKLYRWKSIKHFWFSEKDDVVFLHLDIKEDDTKTITKRITLILNEPGQDNVIFDFLIRFIDFGEKEEISFSYLTRLTEGKYYEIEKYLPDEKIKIMHDKKDDVKKNTNENSSNKGTSLLDKLASIKNSSK
ncbi:MAG: hypothetical protein ABI721_04330 [Candidatus Dojkabacteria bacterium]